MSGARGRGRAASRGATPRVLPGCAALLAFAALLASMEPARAEVPHRIAAQLEYRRDAGATARCPDEHGFRDEARALLGYDPFQADAAVRVATSIERQGGELVADMRLLDEGGQALWQHSFGTRGRCDALVAAMALAVVVKLETMAPPPTPTAPPQAQAACPPGAPGPAPAAAARPAPTPIAKPAPVPAGEPAPAPAAEPAPTPAAKLPRARAASGDWPHVSVARVPRLQVAAVPMLAAGATPGISIGIGWRLAARWESMSAAVEGRALVSPYQEVEGVGVEGSYFASGVAFCLQGDVAFACGRGELGTLRFGGDPRLRVLPDRGPIVGLAGRLGAEWPLSGRFSLVAYVDALGIVTQSKLWLTTAATAPTGRRLWTSSQLSPSAGIGIAATF